jgi:hypothetical protein
VTHDNVTDLSRGHFGIEVCVDIRLNILDNAFNDVAFDGAFGASSLDSTANFLTVQRLAGFVSFDDSDAETLNFFSGRKSPLARVAESFSSDHVATFGCACVQNTVIIDVTVGTTHAAPGK